MVEDAIKERLKHEVIGILLIAAGIFLFFSLISYHPIDPSFFSHTSSKIKEIHNWMGIVGSYLAGLLFQAFGFPVFLIPFVLGLFAFSFIFRWELKFLFIRLTGWSLILLATSSLLALWCKPIEFRNQELLTGGFVGEILARGLARYFNFPGATIVLLIVLILAFVLGTGISFIALLRLLGIGIGDLVEKLGTLKTMRKERSQRARKLQRQKQERGKGGEVALPTVIDTSSSSAPLKEIVEQKPLPFADSQKAFHLPPISLLEADVEKRQKIDRDSLIMNSRILEKKLLDYGVEGRVVEVRPGPVITVYEFEPAPGVKVSRIANLADDLALALSAISIRIVAPIPGKSVVGIEIPNAARETVFLKEIIDSDPFRNSRSRVSFGLGKDISGEPFVVDLARMPHLLVAGSTGSGKSVSINSMICSILFKATPNEVRFIMID
ncbi:MAG: DNA translocase FtsK, partial [Deltaproteobacteria bacterium]